MSPSNTCTRIKFEEALNVNCGSALIKFLCKVSCSFCIFKGLPDLHSCKSLYFVENYIVCSGATFCMMTNLLIDVHVLLSFTELKMFSPS